MVTFASEELDGRRWKLASDSDLAFYRQPGGCLEVIEANGPDEADDIVHVCSQDVASWYRLLGEFIEKTGGGAV